jgi:hypothetical protein
MHVGEAKHFLHLHLKASAKAFIHTMHMMIALGSYSFESLFQVAPLTKRFPFWALLPSLERC